MTAEWPQSRRNFLKLSGASFLSGVGFGTGRELAKSVAVETIANQIVEHAPKLISNFIGSGPKREPMNRDRRDLIYHLFLRSEIGDTRFRPAANWTGGRATVRIADGQVTYGHEATVCNSMADFLNIDLHVPYERLDAEGHALGPESEIVVGSGSSNEHAARYVGTPEFPRFNFGSLHLHYGVGQGKGKLKRFQYGEMIERNAHTICDKHQRPLLQPESENGSQKDDYLLVTRLPGETPGTCVTLFTGLHGPGTRAAELLFDPKTIPLEDLRKLARIVDARPGENRYYQAVFRASEFDRNLKNDETMSDVATRLELMVDQCPPVRL